jgi:hypothetical protein
MRRFAVGVTAVVAALASSLGKHGFSWAYSPDRTTIALGGFAVASSSSTRAAPPAFDRAARVPETSPCVRRDARGPPQTNAGLLDLETGRIVARGLTRGSLLVFVVPDAANRYG